MLSQECMDFVRISIRVSTIYDDSFLVVLDETLNEINAEMHIHENVKVLIYSR